jgi:mannan endo-1,4-beta-mannosidase
MAAAPRRGGRTEFDTLDYLHRISGSKTLSGQHNREPNAEPARWTDRIHEVTGTYPALWSGDFLFQQENIDHRWTMIHQAEEQWRKGAVINLMLHTCPPGSGEPCKWDPGVLNHQLTDEQWKKLVTVGTPLYEAWTDRLDRLTHYFRYLERRGVEVMFRPLHEMNQGKFWWGGRPGPGGTRRLYQITHDYLEEKKELSNVIWVWDMQDLSRDFKAYDPGDDYWDVFAFDVYEEGFDKSWYDYILPIVGDKPMGIGECSTLPSTEMLVEQPRWTFFMAWAELVKKHNSPEEIRAIYSHPRVVTRNEVPGWGRSWK